MTGGQQAQRRDTPRHQFQSDLLSGAVGTLLALKATLILTALHRLGAPLRWLPATLAVSLGFALLVWLLRAATAPAAALGALVCLNLLLGQGLGQHWQQTGVPALVALFILTFAATRFGRRHKERLGIAEPPRGRRASQVAANLGIAGLCGGAATPLLFAATLAALAEATADTVSSELGQVLGGRTLLITTWKPVLPGTDGGVSLGGTSLGAAAAGLLILVTAATRALPWPMGMVIFAAATCGLLLDSLLGATLERRGWLGNDLVNFLSTAAAAAIASLGTYLLARH